MKYFWNNLIDLVTTYMEPNTEELEFPLENVANQLIEKVWMDDADFSPPPANVYAIIDFGTPMDVDTFICAFHTLLATDTIKIQACADNVWVDPIVNVDLTALWTSGPIKYEFAETKTYQYWRFIYTKGNPTGTAREVGRLFLGMKFDIAEIKLSDRNFSIMPIDPSIISESDSKQRYSNIKEPYNEYAVSYDALDDTDKAGFESMFIYCGLHTAFFAVIDEDDEELDDVLYLFIKDKIPKFIPEISNWKLDCEYREVV
jgi:hypothetical protein